MQVFFALTISAVGVSQTSALAPDTNKAKYSAASILDIIDSKPRIDSSSTEGITLPSVIGNIKLEHVSFRYPTRPDTQIFKDLSLNIPSGKVDFLKSFLSFLGNVLFQVMIYLPKQTTIA